MAEIARRLGVSKATVSRALADSPRVPAARREQVAALAAELGWRPDARLGYLSALRWRGRDSGHCVIAWLCDRYTVLHPAKRRALQTHGAALGYRVEYWRMDERPGRDLARRLRDRGVQGVLVDLHASEAPPVLAWENHSAIVMGEGHAGLRLHRVATDWMTVFELVGRRVVDEKRRTLLLAVRRFVGDGLTRELARAAWALRPELLAAGVACEVELLDEADEAAGGRLDALLASGRFDAVLTCTAAATDLALRATRAGRRAAVYGLMQAPRPDEPSLAALDIQLELRARTALDLLHLELLSDRRGAVEQPVRHLLPGRWL